MRLETLKGPDLGRLMLEARASRGDDVVIVATRRLQEGALRLFEIAVADAAEVQRFRTRIEAPAPPAPRRTAGARPRVVALVGPTGAGKTTTAAKLALHPRAFGECRVGLLSLDTYRVAALEQIQTYAEIAQLPLEVVYEAAEVAGAMARLDACDLVLVDTPGRSPRSPADDEWALLLQALAPDEVHLVLPAGLRADVAVACADRFRACRPTHLLLTKLDEVPGETGLAELAEGIALPTRWITDGQEVPSDLKPAAPRILASLGTVPGSAA